MDKKHIPDRWEWRELGELGEIHTGSTPRRSNEDYWGGDIAWASPKDMGERRLSDTEDAMTEKALEETSSTVFPKGTIIFVMRSSILEHTFPVSIADTEITINQDMKAIQPIDDIDPRYLLYFLKREENRILDKCTKDGTTVVSMDADSLYSYEVPVPPITEQRAISAKIDSLFERVDEARAAQEQAEKLEDKALFSIFLDMVEEAETQSIQTGDVIDESQYGISEAMNEEGRGYPILRMGNYDSKGNMDYSEVKHVELSDDEFQKYRLVEGDILFNRTNSKELVGKTAIYDGELEDAVFASYLIRVYVDENKVLPEYFVNYLNSPRGQAELDKKAKQAVSQANINSTELRELDFELPTLAKQHEIVERLTSMEDRLDEIRSASDRMSAVLNALPKSILDKAFRGELIDYKGVEDKHEKSKPEPKLSDGSGQVTLEDFSRTR